jgi:2-C-methyl-D-erythritol 4-phosphate cytidylyltransferase
MIVLLHDAARPLAPPTLARAVVAAVRAGADVAVPVLPMTDTVKRVDESGLICDEPDRAQLRVMQTPMAVRAHLLKPDHASDVPPDPTDISGLLAVAMRWAEHGTDVRAVPGDPSAFTLHTAWDRDRAEYLAERPVVGPGRRGTVADQATTCG